MKPHAVLGLILIIVGILILVFQGTLFATQNTAVPGAVKSGEKDPNPETVPVPQIIGAVSVAGGIFLVVLGSRK